MGTKVGTGGSKVGTEEARLTLEENGWYWWSKFGTRVSMLAQGSTFGTEGEVLVL